MSSVHIPPRLLWHPYFESDAVLKHSYDGVFENCCLLGLFDPAFRYRDCIDGRRLAKLASGRYSMVPAWTREGDILLRGWQLPLIVRPLSALGLDQSVEVEIRSRLMSLTDEIHTPPRYWSSENHETMPIQNCTLVGYYMYDPRYSVYSSRDSVDCSWDSVDCSRDSAGGDPYHIFAMH